LIAFSRGEYETSLMILNMLIQGMKKHRCYRAVKHFFADNALTMNEHFDEFFSLLDDAKANLRSRRLVKADARIRAQALLAKWVYLHLGDQDPNVVINSYPEELHFSLNEIETDGIDLGLFRLPLVQVSTERETDERLEQCNKDLTELSHRPFPTLIFFQIWLPILRRVEDPGSVYAEIQGKWQCRLKTLGETQAIYKSPVVLLRLINNYAKRTAHILSRHGPKLPSHALAQFAQNWVTYFRDLETTFAGFAKDYSSRTLLSHAASLKEVASTLVSFQSGAVTLDAVVPKLGVSFIANSIHVCVVKVLDFLSIFDKVASTNDKELFVKCYNMLYDFRISVEHSYPFAQYGSFYQVFGSHLGLFLQLLSRYEQTGRFSRQRLREIGRAHV
jgi:hypothetical protein